MTVTEVYHSTALLQLFNDYLMTFSTGSTASFTGSGGLSAIRCKLMCTPGMGVNLSALSSRPKGLWGVSPLYVNPVNMLNILTKVLAEGKGVPVREGLKEAPLSGINLRAKL
jgi:hypothetical protein